MATQVQRRRGTTAQHATFTGALGELTVDTDLNTLVVHDGSTAGGFPLMGRFTNVFHAPAVVPWAWDNMPAAATFLFGSHRHVTRLSLTGFHQCRLVVNVQSPAAPTNAKLILRYKTTSFSTTVGDYSDIGTSEVSVVVDTANSVVSSSWISLAAAAKADVFVTIVGSGGDGSTDPVFGTIEGHFR